MNIGLIEIELDYEKLNTGLMYEKEISGFYMDFIMIEI